MKKIYHILLCISFFCTCLYSREESTIYQFLHISPSPEAVSMGNANISIPGNAFCLYYNPALSAFYDIPIKKTAPFTYTPSTYPDELKQTPFIHNIKFSLSYAKYYEALNYGSAFSILSTEAGSIGIGFINLFHDDIYKTELDASGDYIELNESIDLRSYCMLLNYSVEILDKFSIGVNAKRVVEKVDEYNGNSICFDGGLSYLNSIWGVGIIVRNIGPTVKYQYVDYDLPLNIELGAHTILQKHLIHSKDRLLISGKIKSYLDDEIIIGIGLEYKLNKYVFLRAGYQLNGIYDGIKYGLGCHYRNIFLDYTFNSYENLGFVHNIGLSTRLNFSTKDKSKEQKELQPQKSRRGLEIGVRNNALFELRSKKIKEGSNKALTLILTLVQQYPRYLIKIEANAYDYSSSEKNFDLSEERATAIKKYLVKNNIDKNRMQAVGLGDSNPVIKEDDPVNQRVDIIFIKLEKNKSISRLIDELPESEKKKVEQLYFFGLDCYYKEDFKGAIKHWKKIKTTNTELQNIINQKIKEMQ